MSFDEEDLVATWDPLPMPARTKKEWVWEYVRQEIPDERPDFVKNIGWARRTVGAEMYAFKHARLPKWRWIKRRRADKALRNLSGGSLEQWGEYLGV